MKPVFLILTSALLAFQPVLAQEKFNVEHKQGKSGKFYTVFLKNRTAIHFTTIRPDTSDKSIQLCIPAAFSQPGYKGVDGIYAVDGVVYHRNRINSQLGGVLLMEKEEVCMLDGNHGRAFSAAFLQQAEARGSSFFQQIWCIVNGKAESFKDAKLRQRRGIALMNDGSLTVIESEESITLKTFSEDLAELGVKNLMYTDMGSYSGGWYRDPEQAGKVVVIGFYRWNTSRQTNWVIFKN